MTPDMFRELVIKFVESKDYKDPDEKFGSDWDFAQEVMQDFCRFIGMDIVIPDAPEITDDERQQANETRSRMLVDLLPYVETICGMKYRKSETND
jgi:hypothetical protein